MRAFAILCLLALALPAAVANDHGEAGPDDHVVVVATIPLEEGYYLVEDHGAFLLFRETNGVLAHGVHDTDGNPTGLQPADFCLHAEGITYVHPDEACETGERFDGDEQITNGVILEEAEHILHGEER